MKKIYIFGNDLGRSFNNDFFSLERVLKVAWSDDGPLSEEQRALIKNCLSDEVIEAAEGAPTDEGQLRDLQRVVDACDLIGEFQRRTDSADAWLTQQGAEFPKAVRKYFHFAASQFHRHRIVLPEEFAASLRKFVRDQRPHIATLNYDDLLYEAFTDTDIFSGHMLRDGFFGKFDIARHRDFIKPIYEGWFLHLHGSPLFVTKNGEEKKLTRAQLAGFMGSEKTHLVLTDAKSKPAAIKASPILNEYWRTLRRLLNRPHEVTLFGYGGGDLHLNRLLANTNENVKIRLVTRTPDDEEEAMVKWRSLLTGKDLDREDLFFLEKVTNFRDW